MDTSTGSWFEYLRQEVLTEGLRDIGLPESIIDFIEDGMPNAPEKSKMYAGNNWKEHKLGNPGYIDSVQENWLNQMERMFPDQLQVTPLEPQHRESHFVARVMEPYDTSAIRTTPREMYDDKTVEQNKKIAFVADNIKQAWAKPAGTWRKTFMKALKALSKAGVPSEKVEVVKEYLNEQMLGEWRTYWGRYNELFSWLNDEPTNYEMIKGDDIDSAYQTAMDDLENREDPDNIIHTFEDGSYWYNLQVSNCPVEGERMGHCGGDTRGVLVSLRKRQGKRKASSSYITMTWHDETLYQIKGRSNDAPPEEMWDHIEWFIRNMGITSVEEAGEHSNDYDGFQEMNDYLSTRNRHVNFTGQIDEAAIQEAVDEVVNDYEAENSSIYGEVNGPDDHGGEGVYVYMNAECNIQIDLGWKGFELRNNEFTPTIAPNDTTRDTRFETIPENTWGTSARDFTSEVDLDELGYDLPGEGEVEWDIRMLTGAQPEGEDIDHDHPATAHLEISIRTMEQEDAGDEDEAAQNMQYFSESVIENFEDVYEELKEKLRSKLAEGGYSAKTPFDREKQGMGAMELDNWKIWQDGPKMEFWFRRGQRDDNAVLNSGGDIGSVSNMIKMWGFDETREGHMDGIYRKMFGSRPMGRPGRIENDDLSRNMARNLEKLYSAAETPTGDQQSLPLGDKYKAPAAKLVLAKDSRFIVMPETTLKHEQYPAMLTNWKYEIGVDAKSSPEEVEVVKDIVHYFNARPDMVEEAAAETIRSQVQGITALANATKADVMSGKWPQHAIQHIDSQYGGRAASGSDEWAERVIMIAIWIKENFDQMGEVEKWVAWYKFLKPLKEGYFNHARDGDIEMDDDANLGRPESWSRKVKEQMTRLGTYGGTVRNYSGVSIQENIEDQIERIEKLLQEKDSSYDLRIYSIVMDVSVSKDVGGEVQETQTEIRGINGVTTVRTLGNLTPTGVTHTGKFEIKFEILGGMSRVKYRDRVLIPGMARINGLKILRVSPIHRTNKRGTIRTVREAMENAINEAGFGGMAGAMSSVRTQNTRTMPTPRGTLDDIMADWRDGGVMTYDAPMDTTDMRYHVMMPVEEMWEIICRSQTKGSGPMFRAPKDGFDGMYQNFIRNGATAPVYIAIGKNGKIKVTGNEDLIWYAKESGLEELPVFLSYQSQV